MILVTLLEEWLRPSQQDDYYQSSQTLLVDSGSGLDVLLNSIESLPSNISGLSSNISETSPIFPQRFIPTVMSNVAAVG